MRQHFACLKVSHVLLCQFHLLVRFFMVSMQSSEIMVSSISISSIQVWPTECQSFCCVVYVMVTYKV